MQIKYLIIIPFLLLATLSRAQSEIELADHYYATGEYALAKLYYEQIYKTNRTNKIYTQYLNTLVALGELEEAEKIVQKKIKSQNDKSMAYIDLGDLYLRFGEDKKAEAQLENALKYMEPGRGNVTRLANAFIKINAFDYALRCYQKGIEISDDGYQYNYELANLQGSMGDFEGMIDSYLALLRESPHYIQTVQNSLSRNLDIYENEDHAEMLRTRLLKNSQNYPEVNIYTELLIWLFLQRKDFDDALIQAMALDKRLGENGYRIHEIAQLALSNNELKTAKKAFNYLIEKGPQFDYFIIAKTEYLRVSLLEVTSKKAYTEAEIKSVADLYEATIEELGKSASTAILLKEYAHIRAFYLHESQEAIDLLYDALDLPGLYGSVKAVIKLELGDILLLEGELWDASLLYSQVELDFKEDPLGHEAKFRNAKISYYTGDFEWAQAQLDVLKASTSKLISNDAIELSLLITDNFAMDTLTLPMELFAQAQLLAYQNHIPEAFVKLDSIQTRWPAHALSDEILMLKAGIYEKQGQYDQTVILLEEVLSLYFYDIHADDALFQLAEIHETVYMDEAKALELYEKLILEFPGSLYVVEARKRFRRLRGDQLN